MKRTLNENQLKQIIAESIRARLNETATITNGLCSKLQAIENKVGRIKRAALSDECDLSDIKNEDITKITKTPDKTMGFAVELENGYYVLISNESDFVKNIETRQNEFQTKKAEREKLNANNLSRDLQRGKEKDAANKEKAADFIKRGGDEKTAEKIKAGKTIDTEEALMKTLTSVKKVRDYINEKYGEFLHVQEVRSKRGRIYYPRIDLGYISGSYESGPHRPSQELVKVVDKLLSHLGYYYDGNYENNDEKQWTSYGRYTWRKNSYYE